MNDNTATIPLSGIQLGMKTEFIKAEDVIIPDIFFQRFTCGYPVIDELFGGEGFVPSMTGLVSGTAGSGKTTLMLQIMQSLANKGKRVGYVSGEESIYQLAFASRRLDTPLVHLANITDVDEIVAKMQHLDFIVVDSFQSLTSSEVSGPTNLENYAVNRITQAAKETKCIVFFVCHMTKDNKFKGGTIVPHTVDATITLYNGDPEIYGRNSKMIEVTKNRFGSQGEVILRMGATGFDFENPIEMIDKQAKDDNERGANVSKRAASKVNDKAAIMDIIKKSNRAKISDMVSVCDDVGRIQRLCKELELESRLVRIGRGNEAYYVIGDEEDTEDRIAS